MYPVSHQLPKYSDETDFTNPKINKKRDLDEKTDKQKDKLAKRVCPDNVHQYPLDAQGEETTHCSVPFQEKHLARFAEIALDDMASFFKKRPELERHRFCVVLAQKGADHYLHQTGFQCISLFTFFKKTTRCKDFHPLRHTRVDFGTDEFGHSSWIKHPGDKGFTGRGINCFGRSIPFQNGDTYKTAIQRYVTQNKSSGAASLKKHAIVVLWPKEQFGEVIWDPQNL